MEQIKLYPRFLSETATLKNSTSAFLASDDLSMFLLKPERHATPFHYLSPLWNRRNIELTEDTENHPLFSERDYTQIDYVNPLSPLSTVLIDAVYAYNIFNVTIVPALKHVLIPPNHTVAERFGDHTTFLANMGAYGKYFGFDHRENCFNIYPKLDHFNVFNGLKKASVGGFTPILISNDSNDRCLTHWIMSPLQELFLLSNVIEAIERPLLVFSYPPEKWQLESIALYMNHKHLSYMVIDAPTIFNSVITVSNIREHWFNGEFLAMMYDACGYFNTSVSQRRIFISRDDATSRRIVNQREINTILLKFGYSIVEMSKFSFSDQIQIIRGADSIIFINGSSGANLFHANQGARVAMVGGNRDKDGTWVRSLKNFGFFNLDFFEATEVLVDGSIWYYAEPALFELWLSSVCTY